MDEDEQTRPATRPTGGRQCGQTIASTTVENLVDEREAPEKYCSEHLEVLHKATMDSAKKNT